MRKLAVAMLCTMAFTGASAAYGETLQQHCPANQPLRMAITLDDLPFADRTLSVDEQKRQTAILLRTLKAHTVPAIGFVNEDKLLVNGEVSARIGLLRMWLEAGMTLGNHGFGHLGLQKTPLAKAEAAVLRGDVITRWLMNQYGEAPRYYRYPYNQTGSTREIRDAFTAFLERHGYAVAPFTIQNGDYVYDRVYAYDLSHGKDEEAKRVRKAYLAHLPVVMQAHEKMTEELFGRQIAQIFDLHANLINAASLDAMLSAMQRHGYCFISLAQALKDPAYATPDDYAGPYGMTWLRRWAKGKDVNFSVYPPDPQGWIMKRYKVISEQAEPSSVKN